MEQIKNKKKLEKQRREEEEKAKQKQAEDDIVVSTQELNIEDDYAALDSGEENVPPSSIDVVDGVPAASTHAQPSLVASLSDDSANILPSNSTNTTAAKVTVNGDKNIKKDDSSGVESDEEEDGTSSNNYVIAGDVDVDDDWMAADNKDNNKDGGSDSEDEENDGASVEDSVVRIIIISLHYFRLYRVFLYSLIDRHLFVRLSKRLKPPCNGPMTENECNLFNFTLIIITMKLGYYHGISDAASHTLIILIILFDNNSEQSEKKIFFSIFLA